MTGKSKEFGSYKPEPVNSNLFIPLETIKGLTGPSESHNNALCKLQLIIR